MSSEKGSFWSRFFQARTDFITLLDGQLDLAAKAMGEFLAWCETRSQTHVDAVYQLEKDADQVRQQVINALGGAFETPLDREDVDDLSRCIDDIVDGIRYAVREAVALRVKPDSNIQDMARNVEAGIVSLRTSVSGCRNNRAEAQQYAGRARHVQRLNERVYIQAMACLLDDDNDFKTIFRQREGYRQMIELTGVLELAAERVEHALNKLG